MNHIILYSRRLIQFLFFLLVYAIPGYPQSSIYQFEKLSTENGLSQSTVLCSMKDSKGFMWFGTFNGLNLYDGHSFKIYQPVPGDSLSLICGHIKVLLEDSRSNIWVGTATGGLHLFNRELESFQVFGNEKQNHFVSGKNITALCEDSEGNIWVGTDGDGITIIDRQGFTTRVFKHDPIDNTSLSSNKIRAILEDSRKNIWIGTLDIENSTGGLNLFSPQTNSFKRYMHNPADQNSIGSNFIKCLHEDIKGRLWIGTDNGGINRYNYYADDYTRSNVIFPELKKHNLDVWSITSMPDDILWFGTNYSGLFSYNIHNKSVTQFSPNPDDLNSISSHRIWNTYYDPAGILWIGTHDGGVSRINFNSTHYNHYRIIPNQVHSLRSNNIKSVLQDSKGRLWVGTIDGGLSSMDTKNQFFNFITNRNGKIYLEAENVYSILEGSDEKVLFATNRGLFYYNYKAEAIFPLSRELGSHPLLNIPISSLGQDKSGNIWVGTWNNGLYWIDRDGNIHPYENQGGIKLSNKWISNIFIDHLDNVWFSVDGYGFFRLDKDNRSLRQYLFENSNNKGITKVYTFHEDEKGILWLGVENSLIQFNPTTGSFQPAIENLNGSVVMGILGDNQNRLWLSTTRGISIYDKITEEIEHFITGSKSGFTEYNEGACFKSIDGELFFGGKNGLISIYPENMVKNKHIPPVVLTDFKIFYKSILPGAISPLKQSISQTREIRLTNKQSTFTFSFAALDYTKPENNQYTCILEGFEEQWNFLGNKNEANYTNVPPGIYTFRIKGSNNDGVWNESGTEIRVKIVPPFYQRAWFTYLSIILVLISVITFYAVRIRNIKQRKNELEVLVAKRTEKIGLQKELLEKQTFELRNLNDSITSKNQELELQKARVQKMAKKIHNADKAKIQFFTNISHEFRTPLTLILGAMDKLVSSELMHTPFFLQLRIMQRNANRLLKLINELLDFSKLEYDSLKLSIANGNIVDFIQSVYFAFTYRAERRKINFQFKSTRPYVNCFFDGDKLEKILYNIISNSFKFTPDAGCIQVNVSFLNKNSGEDTHCVISVKDKGIGIDTEKQKKIFKRFYQNYDQIDNTNEGTGIGLALANSLAIAHNGSIEVKSEPGKGSEFIVTLPIGREFYKDDDMGVEVPKLSDNLILEEIREGIYDARVAQSSISQPLSSIKGKKILVVEDNDEVRSFIVDELKEDFEVFEANDGVVGWDMACSVKPDLIICDLLMPRLDGIELCGKLRNEASLAHIPIIILTAVSNDEVKLKGFEIGADDYITKPFNSKIVKVRVNNLLLGRVKLREKFSKEPFIEASDIASNSMDTQFLKRAIQVVEDNIFNSEFDYREFLNEMAMSKTQLYRKINALSGQSPTDFIRTIKLKKAARMIAMKEMTISEITYQMGFTDPSYFTKVFKKQFGMLPSKYAEYYAEQNIK